MQLRAGRGQSIIELVPPWIYDDGTFPISPRGIGPPQLHGQGRSAVQSRFARRSLCQGCIKRRCGLLGSTQCPQSVCSCLPSKHVLEVGLQSRFQKRQGTLPERPADRLWIALDTVHEGNTQIAGHVRIVRLDKLAVEVREETKRAVGTLFWIIGWGRNGP